MKSRIMTQHKWIVRVCSKFSAAHALTRNGERIEPLHGHNYFVEIFIAYEGHPDKAGVTVDFVEVRRVLDEVTGHLHMRNLNDEIFRDVSPSAEHIGLWIKAHFLEKWKGPGELVRIRIWENDDRYVELVMS